MTSGYVKKQNVTIFFIILLLTFTTGVSANPVGEQVVAGQAGFNRVGNQLNINQLTDRVIINWQDFSIANGELTKFVQPNSRSAALNRVITGNLSSLLGDLQANGQVYLINPNGIVVGADANINTQSFIASTLDVDNDQFMQGGDLNFVGDSEQTIEHLGTIEADGGDVFLIAKHVDNSGTINADGHAGLAGGTDVLLKASGDDRLAVRVTDKDGRVDQKGLVEAAKIELRTAGNNPYALAINHEGISRATSAVNKKGRIILFAENGTTKVDGTLDASAPESGDGGFIETSGTHVKIANTVNIDTSAANGETGTWLIDPNDFTVTASGGDITATTLATQLDSNNVTIETASQGTPGGNGDIFVNEDVSWSSNNNLTLNAERHIEVNNAITNTGAGDINLNAGDGANGSAGANGVNTGDSGVAGQVGADGGDIIVNAAISSNGGAINLIAGNGGKGGNGGDAASTASDDSVVPGLGGAGGNGGQGGSITINATVTTSGALAVSTGQGGAGGNAGNSARGTVFVNGTGGAGSVGGQGGNSGDFFDNSQLLGLIATGGFASTSIVIADGGNGGFGGLAGGAAIPSAAPGSFVGGVGGAGGTGGQGGKGGSLVSNSSQAAAFSAVTPGAGGMGGTGGNAGTSIAFTGAGSTPPGTSAGGAGGKGGAGGDITIGADISSNTTFSLASGAGGNGGTGGLGGEGPAITSGQGGTGGLGGQGGEGGDAGNITLAKLNVTNGDINLNYATGNGGDGGQGGQGGQGFTGGGNGGAGGAGGNVGRDIVLVSQSLNAQGNININLSGNAGLGGAGGAGNTPIPSIGSGPNGGTGAVGAAGSVATLLSITDQVSAIHYTAQTGGFNTGMDYSLDAGNHDVTLQTAGSLNPVSITGNNIDLTVTGLNSGIGTSADAIVLLNTNLLNASAGNGNGGIYLEKDGDITLGDTLLAGTGDIEIRALSGSIITGAAPLNVTAANLNLTTVELVEDNVTFSFNGKQKEGNYATDRIADITVGTGGIDATGTNIIFNSADSIIIDGVVNAAQLTLTGGDGVAGVAGRVADTIVSGFGIVTFNGFSGGDGEDGGSITINAQLNIAGDVQLTAGAGGQGGNGANCCTHPFIQVFAGDAGAGGNAGNIIINNSLTTVNGNINLVTGNGGNAGSKGVPTNVDPTLDADGGNAGIIVLNASLDSTNGDINLNANSSGGTSPGSGAAGNDGEINGSVFDISTINGNVAINGPINAGSNDVLLNAGDQLTISDLITANNINLTAAGSNAAIGTSGSAIQTNASGIITASASNGNGGIYIAQQGDWNITTDSFDANTGDIELTAVGGQLTTSSSAFNISGTNLTLTTTEDVSNNTLGDRNIQIGSGGISASNTNLTFNSADDVIVDGAINTASVTATAGDGKETFGPAESGERGGAITVNQTLSSTLGNIQLTSGQGGEGSSQASSGGFLGAGGVGGNINLNAAVDAEQDVQLTAEDGGLGGNVGSNISGGVGGTGGNLVVDAQLSAGRDLLLSAGTGGTGGTGGRGLPHSVLAVPGEGGNGGVGGNVILNAAMDAGREAQISAGNGGNAGVGGEGPFTSSSGYVGGGNRGGDGGTGGNIAFNAALVTNQAIQLTVGQGGSNGGGGIGAPSGPDGTVGVDGEMNGNQIDATAANGGITIDGFINPDAAGSVSLLAGIAAGQLLTLNTPQDFNLTGTGSLSLQSFAFSSSNNYSTVDGDISINSGDGALGLTGTVTATNGDVTLTSSGNLSASQIITGNNINLTATGTNSSIGSTGAGAIQTSASGIVTATASNGNGGIFLSEQGDFDISNLVLNTGTGNAEVTAVNGNLTTGTTAFSFTGANLLLVTTEDASNNTAGDRNIQIGTGGISANATNLTLNSADDVIVGGVVDAASFIAMAGDGSDGSSGGDGGDGGSIHVQATINSQDDIQLLAGEGGNASDGSNGPDSVGVNQDGGNGGDGGHGGHGGNVWVDNTLSSSSGNVIVGAGNGGAGGDGGDGGDGTGLGTGGDGGDGGDGGNGGELQLNAAINASAGNVQLSAGSGRDSGTGGSGGSIGGANGNNGSNGIDSLITASLIDVTATSGSISINSPLNLTVVSSSVSLLAGTATGQLLTLNNPSDFNLTGTASLSLQGFGFSSANNYSTVDGDIFINSGDGDLVLGSGFSAGSTGAGNIVLAAGANFHNDSGGNAPFSVNTGRFVVYSTRPDNNRDDIGTDTNAIGHDFVEYGTIFDPNNLIPASLPAGNGFVYSVQPVLTGITVTVNNQTIDYGQTISTIDFSLVGGTPGSYEVGGSGINAAEFELTTPGGITAGDITLVLDSSVGLSTAGFAEAGSYTSGIEAVFASGTSTGLSLDGVGDLTVNTIDVNVTLDADDKVYDATTDVILSIVGDDRIAGDILTLDPGTSVFADKNVGVGKAITLAGTSLMGDDAGNYNLVISNVGSLTADITAADLIINGAVAQDKVYDGMDAATITGAGITALLSDDVNLNLDSATFADKNVGVGKTVTASHSISGADAGNYNLIQATGLTADITARILTAALTADDKIYDALTTGTGSITDDRVAGDVLTLNNSGINFDDKNVGVGKTVTAAGLSLSGTDAGNYVLASTTANDTADITVRTLNAVLAADNKIYDATATATGLISDDRVAGDVLTINNTGVSFDDKNVDIAKTVTAGGLSLSGTDAGNYILAATSVNDTAAITVADLIISGATAQNKVYEGTANAAVSGGTVTALLSDSITLNLDSADFADKNVGTGKTVSTVFSLSGVDAGNYNLIQPGSLTADITARTLTATFTADDKVYDATTAATAVFGDDRIAGDVLTISNSGLNFNDKNVGTGKTVDAIGLSLSGADAGNYVLASSTANDTANITARTIIASLVADDKVYDATTIATGSLNDDRIAGDVLTIDNIGFSFSDKNVGAGKTVTADGLSLNGTDAGNYVLASTSTNGTADITAADLLITGATGQDKMYDGTTTATVSGSGVTALLTDVVSLSLDSASFADKNVDTNKTVTISYSISGADAGNYNLIQPVGLTADITARTLNATLTADNKIYDATTTATGLLADDRVTGDVLTINSSDINFSDANAGTDKTVTVSGLSISGADAGNYALASSTADTIADITPVPLTIIANDLGRDYDGTAFNGGNDVTYSGFVADENQADLVGALTFGGSSQGATDVGNYVITPGGLTSTNYDISFVDGELLINSIPLSITANDFNKVFDGVAFSGGNGVAFNGFVGNDDISDLFGSLDFGGSSQGAVNPGEFVIAPQGLSSNNYDIAFVDGTLTIEALTSSGSGSGGGSTGGGGNGGSNNRSNDIVDGFENFQAGVQSDVNNSGSGNGNNNGQSNNNGQGSNGGGNGDGQKNGLGLFFTPNNNNGNNGGGDTGGSFLSRASSFDEEEEDE